jgi:hypothetical protein
MRPSEISFTGQPPLRSPVPEQLPPHQLEGLRRPVTMRDRDPFAEGQRAARENIPAEANPYQNGSDEHALWAAGHEKIAGTIEAGESEGG